MNWFMPCSRTWGDSFLVSSQDNGLPSVKSPIVYKHCALTLVDVNCHFISTPQCFIATLLCARKMITHAVSWTCDTQTGTESRTGQTAAYRRKSLSNPRSKFTLLQCQAESSAIFICENVRNTNSIAIGSPAHCQQKSLTTTAKTLVNDAICINKVLTHPVNANYFDKCANQSRNEFWPAFEEIRYCQHINAKNTKEYLKMQNYFFYKAPKT